MILSAEEITLLKEKNLARLVYCPSLFETPCESLTGEFSKQEKAFHESQACITNIIISVIMKRLIRLMNICY